MRTMKPTGTTASALDPIVLAVAAAALLVNTALPYLGLEAISAPCTLFLALLCTIVLVKSKPVFSVQVLYLLGIALTAFVAGIGVESGGLLIETGVVGAPNGAFSRLFLFYVIFVACAINGFNRFFAGRTIVAPLVPRMMLSKASISLGLAISLATVCAGLGAGLTEGFALLDGVNRYAVRNASSPGVGEFLFNFFLNNEVFVALFLGTVATSADRLTRSFSIALIVTYVLLTVLHGEQFMSTVHFCLNVLTPVVAIRVMNGGGRPALRYIGIGAVAAVVLGTASVFYAYQAQGYDVTQTLASRLLLQGQTWYVVDGDAHFLSAPGAGGFAAFTRVVRSLLSWSAPNFQDYTNLSGLRELMLSYGSPAVLDAYVADDVTFTLGQMAVPVFWFGMAGAAVFVAITGVLYGVLCGLQIMAVMRGGVVLLWLVAKVFAYATFALQQGEYWFLFGSRTLFYATIALLWWLYVDSKAPASLTRTRLS